MRVGEDRTTEGTERDRRYVTLERDIKKGTKVRTRV